jgi:hypothetical protein
MTDRGRHSRRSGVGFYRDILFLIAGILIVGAIVFGGLSVWAGRGNQGSSTTSTTTTLAPATTSTTTSAIPSTTAPEASPATTEATTSTTDTSTTLRETRPPGDVRIVVLNSIGVTGIAADLTDELATLGYQTTPPDNYTPELSDTMIFHADGFSLEALQLTEVIPDGTVAPDPELTTSQGTDIVVVIGRSYQE